MEDLTQAVSEKIITKYFVGLAPHVTVHLICCYISDTTVSKSGRFDL